MKKRILSLALAVMMVFSLLPFAASAADAPTSGRCGSQVRWTLDGDVLTISGTGETNDYDYYQDGNHSPFYGNKTIRKIVVEPGVTRLGTCLFSGCANVEEISLPDTLECIGSNAFSGCGKLKELPIPPSLKTIENYAFSGCRGLTGVYITDLAAWCQIEFGTIASGYASDTYPLYISKNLYLNGELITDLVIPQGVEKIAHHAFYGCTCLRSVSIPDSVTTIDPDAFCRCANLTSVTIPNSVTSIGSGAFSSCAGLTSVAIPNSVTSIGSAAFGYCSGLTSLTIPDGVTAIGNSFCAECSSLESITLPDTVTSIGYGAFKACSALTSFTIPDAVETIGENAFCNCTGLTAIVIPDAVETIGRSAFDGCTSLRSVTIGSGVASLGTYALFKNCPMLESITVSEQNASYSSIDGVLFSKDNTKLIRYPAAKTGYQYSVPSGVTAIGYNAFDGSKNVSRVYLPDSVVEIGREAFANMSCLESVLIPKNVTYLSKDMFKGSKKLQKINIASGNPSYSSVDGVLFNKDRTTLLRCPEGYVGDYVIPNTVTDISESAFYGCEALREVSIPDSVKEIDSNAFANCKGIQMLTIPSGLDTISDYAFQYCTGLKRVVFDTNGKLWVGGDAFYNCTNIAAVEISDLSKWYQIDFGGNYANPTHYSRALTVGGTPITQVVIPDGMTAVPRFAFVNCDGITDVTLPEGLTSIGEKAFFGCNGLTSVAIPSSVAKMGYLAFESCANLKEIHISDLESWCRIESQNSSSGGMLEYNGVLNGGRSLVLNGEPVRDLVIPDGITKISWSLFQGCGSLRSVTIPTSVKELGNYSFYQCDSLRDIYYLGTESEWSQVRDNSRNEAVMHFRSSGGVCGADLKWTLFDNENLIISGTGAMTDYSAANTVPWYASRAGIKSIRIDPGVTTIGANAFGACSALTELIVADDVTEIKNGAFKSCWDLETVYYSGNEDQWNEIAVAANNAPLLSAELRFGVDGPAKVIVSGECGENLTWELNSYGCLTISGTGAMTDYSEDNPAPWQSHSADFQRVEIAEGVTSVGSSAFSQCASMTQISLPESLTSIGQMAFMDAAALTSVTVPANVTEIGRYAFYNAAALKSAELSPGMSEIAMNTFSGCSSLEQVTISENVTSIGKNAFSGCAALSDVFYDGTQEQWDAITVAQGNGALSSATVHAAEPACTHSHTVIAGVVEATCTEDGYSGDTTCTDCGEIVSYGETVPALGHDVERQNATAPTCTDPGYYGDDVCTRCGTVIAWGYELEPIGHAWDDGVITTEPTCTEDGVRTFTCQNDASHTRTEVVPAYGEHIWGAWEPGDSTQTRYCTRCGEQETIPLIMDSGECGENVSWTLDVNGLLTISGTGAIRDYEEDGSPFWENEEIRSIVIEPGVTRLGRYAFSVCSNLTSVSIPATVTSIDPQASWCNDAIQTVTVDPENSAFCEEDGVVYDKDKTCLIYYPPERTGETFVIPESVLVIGDWAFWHSRHLTAVSIPDGVTSIGSGAFSDCVKLESIAFPASVTSLGEQVCYSSESLKSVTLPEGIACIPQYAFGYCTGLTSVTIPKSVTSIGAAAFESCGILADVYYNGSEAQWNAIAIDSGNAPLLNAAIHVVKAELAITQQPQDVSGAVGETVSVSVTATGEGLSYQWQYRQPGKVTWYNSGMTGSATDTLQIPVTAKRDGQSYRCVITDANGDTVTSDAATLTIAVPQIELAITQQPQDVSGAVGETVSVSVTAAGEGLTYQWQYRQPGKTMWYHSSMTGSTTDTLQIPVTAKRDGQSYRCVITDANGNRVTSDAATLTIAAPQTPLVITQQPQNVSGAVGETVTVSVAASGEGLSYQWQYCQAGKTYWYNSGMAGSDTDTLQIPVTAKRDGQSYRCVITDANGNSVTSDAATLTIGEPQTELVITQQPQNVSGAVGETVTVSVAAAGEGLSYQWQYRQPGKTTWYDSGMTGSTTDTLQIPVTAKRDGQSYRCVITDQYGAKIISEACVLTVQP